MKYLVISLFMFYTDNFLNLLSLAPARSAERISYLSNRRLASGTLSVDFQKTFSFLAETNTKTRSVQNIFSSNSEWWRWRELNSRTERFDKRFYKFSPGCPERFCFPVLAKDAESGSPPRTHDMTPVNP
jgi:hypothetical protein